MSYAPQYSAGTQVAAQRQLESGAIVMGLRWNAPAQDARVQPADLDALCVLFDAQDNLLDIIHPGRPRNADGTVVHTGDSKDGAGDWDNERIFVFLQALPPQVKKLVFMVATASDRPLDTVAGASCHVSDPYNDTELMRIDLTTLVGKKSHHFAVASRGPLGWRLNDGEPPND